MPGDQLMCVWQAAYAKDGGSSTSGLTKAAIKAVTAKYAEELQFHYTENEIDAKFGDDPIDFGAYKTYVKNQLAVGSKLQYTDILDKIEDSCWELCSVLYQQSTKTFEKDIIQLWQIFNRLSIEGSYPPVAAKQQTSWLLERVAEVIEIPYKDPNISEDGITFQGLLDFLEAYHFMSESLSVKFHESVVNIHAFLIKGILARGLMYKRTQKKSNWTGWVKRWFVFTPGVLTYYVSEDCTDKKGEVVIDRNSTVEALEKYSGFRRKLTGRFRVSNPPYLKIEMATDNEADKEMWIRAVRDTILAAQENSTPIQLVLRAGNKIVPKMHVGRTTKRRKQRTTLSPSAQDAGRTYQAQDVKPFQIAPVLAKELDALTEQEEEFDNNFSSVERDKIRGIFFNIDKDGNGLIDRDEFATFTAELGLNIDQKESDLVFNIVNTGKTDKITFDEFFHYFMEYVILQKVDTAAENKMRAAFVKADLDGTGKINFREFAEFVWSRSRTMTLTELVKIFDSMDNTSAGELCYEDFKHFVTHQTSLVEESSDEEEIETTLERKMKSLYDKTELDGIATYLRKRWNTFASFKRYGDTGRMVMHGVSGMVADVVPGEYTLLDLACFADLPPIVPKHVVIKNVQWIASKVAGKSGQCIFPSEFDGKLPIEISSNEHLAYYGCSLADNNQVRVGLLYRHGIQDFTYENDYLDKYVTSDDKLGGGGIETHDFAHLDCPFEDDSGHFVIGKLEDGEMHLTAFKVPTRHTVYLPGGTVHSNDYLKGTWRTMLSDEAEIVHTHLMRMRIKDNKTELEHFTFKFY